MESKHIRSDLFWNRIAENMFFSAREKEKIRVWDVIDGDSGGYEEFVHMPQYCESCGAKMDEEESKC